MTINDYISALNKQYRTGIAREHAYRGDLQSLLSTLCPGVTVTNEPARIACGAPDYILTKQQIPVGYIEAKDIGMDLDSKSHKEQFDRYRESLDNLIITDYLEFRFFRDSEITATVRLGEIQGGKVKALPPNFDHFKALITDFAAWQGQPITDAGKLATMMAGKARLLADVINNAVTSDEKSQANTNLRDQLNAFKQILIHDITPSGFGDLYAQTIAYGMFAARLHDPTPDTFSRMEAATLIPESNPFLRKLFQSISGFDLDERIAWIVDALADIFRATDIGKLLSSFDRAKGREDAFMHFYEDFLSQYDPKLRKSRGVWYTPDAVVRFIVRAVDDILGTKFKLPLGLADSSMVQIQVDTQNPDKRTSSGYRKETRAVHRIQVLDPATGTGTFLAEVVRQIYDKFRGQEGAWPQYVKNDLIPRLNGFELLMASYAMAHLKLDLVLRDSGYNMGAPIDSSGPLVDRKDHQRLRIFLTNSLEDAHPDTGTLFANWLSNEAKEANCVKHDTPVMVVLGNPPYSISSSNRSDWIQNLIRDYKKGLKERKLNLDDDYIKFIRYGQYYIDRTGEGILAYITNNSFLDGVTHRQMRKTLLESFSEIYIINLHGNAKKKETTPDGNKDENVFDIMQGVSINIFVKSEKKSSQKSVHYFDIFGTRKHKYKMLSKARLSKIPWVLVDTSSPHYFFVPTNFKNKSEYLEGLSVKDLFLNFNSGIQTKCDEISIKFKESELDEVIQEFSNADIETLQRKYRKRDTSGWNYANAKQAIQSNKFMKTKIAFRPFDERWTVYCDYSGGFIGRPREKTMKHLVAGNNLAVLFPRQAITEKFGIFVSRKICDINLSGIAGQYGAGLVFPLYQYNEPSSKSGFVKDVQPLRRPNLNPDLLAKFSTKLGLQFKSEASGSVGDEIINTPISKRAQEFSPLDLIDYIYAILHSPTYRDSFMGLLKIDFPRVPYPRDINLFWLFAELGGKLRQIHLLEQSRVDKLITSYPQKGSNVITRRIVKKDWEVQNGETGRIWINEIQFFDGIPIAAWESYIGSHQPAKKWLKDRQGRELTFEEILHYQKIIVALNEANRVVQEIDKASSNLKV